VDQLLDALKAIGGILVAIILAIFAKRYSDLKREAAWGKTHEVENEILKATNANDALSTDELMQRENRRGWARFYAKSKKDH